VRVAAALLTGTASAGTAPAAATAGATVLFLGSVAAVLAAIAALVAITGAPPLFLLFRHNFLPFSLKVKPFKIFGLEPRRFNLSRKIGVSQYRAGEGRRARNRLVPTAYIMSESPQESIVQLKKMSAGLADRNTAKTIAAGIRGHNKAFFMYFSFLLIFVF